MLILFGVMAARRNRDSKNLCLIFRHSNILIRPKFVLKGSVLPCLFKLVAVFLNELYTLLQLIDCAVRNGFHVFKKSVRILI